MNEPTLDAIMQRLNRMERGNYWWKRVTIGAFVVISAMILLGQVGGRRQILEVEKLVVKDATGKIRGELGLMTDGAMAVNFFDTMQIKRLALGALADGTPELLFFDQDGQQRIWLTLDWPDYVGTTGFGDTVGLRQWRRKERHDHPPAEKREAPRLSFFDRNGDPSVELVGTETHRWERASDIPPEPPALALYSNERKTQVLLSASSPWKDVLWPGGGRLNLFGKPEVWLSDTSAQNRLRLTLGFDGEPSITLYDKEAAKEKEKEATHDSSDFRKMMEEGSKEIARRTRAVLGVLADGEPYLTLADQDGNQRAVLGYTELEGHRTGTVIKRPASSMVLFDKHGKVIWRAP